MKDMTKLSKSTKAMLITHGETKCIDAVAMDKEFGTIAIGRKLNVHPKTAQALVHAGRELRKFYTSK